MKKLASTFVFMLIVFTIVIPYIFLAEYTMEIRELEEQVQFLQYTVEEEQKQNRLLRQDVEIINNIILEKDFIKRLD